jgi:hypothetical protein
VREPFAGGLGPFGSPRIVGLSALLSTSVGDSIGHACRRDVITVLGDSHVKAFRRMREDVPGSDSWIHAVVVTGATALGLANPNSKTNALELFNVALDPVPRSRRTLVMIGEVDAGFLVWRRAAANGTSVEHELQVSLDRYEHYLEGLLAEGRHRLGVVSVLPPTIDDYATWSGLANERRHVTASLAERTDATVAYNAELRRWTAEHRCVYLDLATGAIDPTTGVIRDELRNPDQFNHHLNRRPLSALVAGQLEALDWSVCESVH